MDDTTRRKLRKEIKADLARLEGEIQQLRALDAYLAGPGNANGSAQVASPAPKPKVRRVRKKRKGGPTLRQRIMEVMQSEPNHAMTVGEIYDRLRDAGWSTSSPNSDAILRSNLRQLAADGQLERTDDRHYSLTAPGFPWKEGTGG